MAKKSVGTAGYSDPSAKAYRSNLRGMPNRALKGAPRELPSGVMSTNVIPPGRSAPEQVGWVNNRWVEATHANTGRQDPDLVHAPDGKSNPSGSTITR